MNFVDVHLIRGVRYGLDSLGWIWRENTAAKAHEAHWLRTGFSTFDQVKAMR